MYFIYFYYFYRIKSIKAWRKHVSTPKIFRAFLREKKKKGWGSLCNPRLPCVFSFYAVLFIFIYKAKLAFQKKNLIFQIYFRGMSLMDYKYIVEFEILFTHILIFLYDKDHNGSRRKIWRLRRRGIYTSNLWVDFFFTWTIIQSLYQCFWVLFVHP